MQVFPVSTVEAAVPFMRLTTTAARANKTTPEKTAKTVSYFSLSAKFSVSPWLSWEGNWGDFSVILTNQSLTPPNRILR